MSDDMRAPLIGALWFCSSIVLVALFISAAAQGELMVAHILIAVVILALVVVGSWYLMRSTANTTELEKVKRQSIDTLLRDMDDDDLIELKRRLSEEEVRGVDVLLDYLEDDGELARKS